jgi:hypothetical protein
LVERYQVQTPKYGDLLFDWLGVNQRGFEFVTDLFAQNKPFVAKITPVGEELSLDWMTDGRDLTSLEMDRDREYITIGKGLYNC